MPYDEKLAARVRALLKPRRGVAEKKMFGGLAFLWQGRMLCGVLDERLMVRVGPEAWAGALARPHTREMDFTGRSMKGLVFVEPGGLRTARQLRAWIGRAEAFVGTLPARPDGSRAPGRDRTRRSAPR